MIECYCDYEPADFYSSKIQTARKQHRCKECGRPILPGEQYENVFAVWYGDPSTVKTCQDCVNLKQWMTINIPCFCFHHGNLHDDVKSMAEEAHFQAPEEVVGLRFGALRRIVSIQKKASQVWASQQARAA